MQYVNLHTNESRTGQKVRKQISQEVKPINMFFVFFLKKEEEKKCLKGKSQIILNCKVQVYKKKSFYIPVSRQRLETGSMVFSGKVQVVNSTNIF